MKKITDISDVKLREVGRDGDCPMIRFTFKDQNGKRQSIEIYGDVLGMIGACDYCHESPTAKKDLIKEINAQREDENNPTQIGSGPDEEEFQKSARKLMNG